MPNRSRMSSSNAASAVRSFIVEFEIWSELR
jgi:hypothetical protein